MSYPHHAQLHRPGKAGIFIVLLLLAVAAAGAVYWFKFRPVTPLDPSTAAVPPKISPIAPTDHSKISPAPSGADGAPAPRKSTSIFDDPSDGTPGAPSPAPSVAAPAPSALDAQKLLSLQTASRNAVAALEAAKAKAKLSPAFVERQAEVDALKAQKEEARKKGTPQEMIALSGQWNRARLSLEADQKKASETDPIVLKAKAEADAAEKNLRQFQSAGR